MAEDTITGGIWNLQKEYEAGRMIEIYEAIKDLPIDSIVEVACGYGTISDGLKWVFPNKDISQFDVFENEAWSHLRVKPYIYDVLDFMKSDEKYDLVIFLNSFRNWNLQSEFKDWLKTHAKYFISSEIGEPGVQVIGTDGRNHALQLWKI
jgi:hypothetical protein